jgi:hypothetical protein
VALVAVLYFLVVAALTSIAVLLGTRMAVRSGSDVRTDASLVAAGDAVVHGALAGWNGPERLRQPIGSTVSYPQPQTRGITSTLWITRLGMRIFSLTTEVRTGANGPARRIALLVRVPLTQPPVATALLSSVDVSLGDGVRVIATDSGACADTATAAVTLAPGVMLSLDTALAPDARPLVHVDTIASDSTAYLALGGLSWDELVARADVHLEGDLSLSPAPVVVGDTCGDGAANWGDPANAASVCAARAPLVHARGDLTIQGGRGQGVLLVDGRLVIAGPFTYSGQIVVRRGIETRADAISLTGGVSAWRATSDSSRTRAVNTDVVLTHGTSLRYSRCDVAHGMASWLQPRAVHARAWTELF